MPTDVAEEEFPIDDRDQVVLEAAQCISECTLDDEIRLLARQIKAVIDRKSNPWYLFRDHPQFHEATAALEAAWQEAIRLSPELPRDERRRLVEEHVYATMEKYKGTGATDTLPRDQIELRFRHLP